MPLPAKPKLRVNPPPDVPVGSHGYFDLLSKRAECIGAWSLRTQSQLNDLVSAAVATNFTYNPSADTYRDPQDAAKFRIPPTSESGRNFSIPTNQQINFNISGTPDNSGAILMTWDFYFGSEFQSNRGQHSPMKTFRFMVRGHRLWTMMTELKWGSAAEGIVGRMWDSAFGGEGADNTLGTTDDTLPAPMGAQGGRREPWSHPNTPINQQNTGQFGHPIRAGVWNRYWVEIRMDQPPSAFTAWREKYGALPHRNPSDVTNGHWMMVSVWHADETTGPTRVLYQIPMSWNVLWSPPRLNAWGLEFNTSKTFEVPGELVGYARNALALFNYPLPATPESDTTIFQRPRR